ncbi:LysE family translocator [Streptomyces sp. NPDC050161]|uniref:LysE family translocator n=1 Tax=Streptomyces sp. NPDC050161 TaxID=3365604 RepID=UPI0037AF2D67
MDHLSVFVATTLLMLVVPGPDFVLVTRHSLAGGRRHGYGTTAGICAGLALLTLVTASGLAAFLAASTAILNLLRVVGGGYLVLLGALLIFSVVHRPRRQSITPQSAPGNVRTAALQGFLNNVLNPKALIFYLTFMPQFLVPGSAFEQSLLLGGLVVLCAAAWWTLYVTAIGYLSAVLTRKTVRTAIDVGAGLALGGIGVTFLAGGL